MDDVLEEFLALPNYAVVGASRHPAKYGYKVVKDLLAKGYTVFPVNPNVEAIEGLACYGTLADIPERIDVVNIVVPPYITKVIVEQCGDLGLKRVWMQPGAESEEAIALCHRYGIEVVHSTCVMVMSGPQLGKA